MPRVRYDANRMQLTSQTATKSGGPTNRLMNLTYGYQAAASQNGPTTTLGNTGQLMSVSGTAGGLNDSASYTYDLLNRLNTSSQTSNGASSQRRFAYDRWGNRTGVWNATSGGTQIQVVALAGKTGQEENMWRLSTILLIILGPCKEYCQRVFKRRGSCCEI